MKADKLMDCIGMIDPALTEEFREVKKERKEKGSWVKWCVAACIVLVVMITAISEIKSCKLLPSEAMPDVITKESFQPKKTELTGSAAECNTDSDEESSLIEILKRLRDNIVHDSNSKLQKMTPEALKKINFDLGRIDNELFSDEEELDKAIEMIKSDEGLLRENLIVTAILKCDFLKDDNCQLLKEKIEKAKNEAEKEEYNAEFLKYAEEYHNTLFENNKALFDIVSYKDIHLAGGSPFVMMTVPATEVKKEWIATLAQNEKIVSLSVSFEYVATDSDFDLTGLTQLK